MDLRSDDVINSHDNPHLNSLLEQVRKESNPVGTLIWTLTSAMKNAGATELEIDDVKDRITHYFSLLSDNQCNSLIDVLYKRLGEGRNPISGFWY